MINGNTIITSFIDDFRGTTLTEYQKYNDSYEARHEVLNREGQLNGISNALIVNFQKLVIDTSHNYLMAKPLNYTNKCTEDSEDFEDTEEFLTELHDLFDKNDEHCHTSDLLKHTAILGDGFEYWYADKQGNIKNIEFPAFECFPIYSPKTRELDAVLRIYEMEELDHVGNKKTYHNVEFYDKEEITYYKFVDGQVFLDTSLKENPKKHFMGECPIIHYTNNREINKLFGQSDLKDIKTLVDNYEEVISSLADTIEYHASPYYVLENAMLDTDQMDEIHRTKMFMLPEDSKISYLTWQQDINAIQFHLDILKKNILELSHTPDLNNEANANLSGIAIKMKFAGADLKANNKELEYRRGLKRRLRLLSKLFNLLFNKTFNSDKIDVLFNRSIPQNLNEIADTMSKLSGIVSKETLISQIPFVSDTALEIERLERDNAGMVDVNKIYSSYTDISKSSEDTEGI